MKTSQAPGPLPVTVDPSEFPSALQDQIHQSLKRRELDQKLLYLSREQALLWNQLHGAYSPWKQDRACRDLYQQAFQAAAALFTRRGPLDLVALGCGPGSKEDALIKTLGPRPLRYRPVDGSFPLLLEAASQPSIHFPCEPYLCDLQRGRWVETLLAWRKPGSPLLLTLFGVLPNLHPRDLFPSIRRLLRPGDAWLFSANFIQGPADLKRILPSYRNPLTTAWLGQFWRDLGLPVMAGRLEFEWETSIWKREKFPRIAAWFHFKKAAAISHGGKKVAFRRGDKVLMFYSYRYTQPQIFRLLEQEGYSIRFQGELAGKGEGVFLAEASK